MEPPRKIEKKKLILAEGADAYFFCIWACRGFDVEDVQVLDFGGIDNLGLFLRMLKQLPRFDMVESIVIARDAELDASAAVQSVQSALSNADFPVPGSPFDFSVGMPRTAFILFPGFSESEEGKEILETGTLEDLCLAMVDEVRIIKCVDEYLACVKGAGKEIKHEHKARLHTYLSGKDKFVGLKVGEAARAGAWDWNHPRLEKMKEIILAM